MDADHVGSKEVVGLAQHAGLGLDAAHTPADHADAVDHGGMAVGADERVRIENAVFLMHAARKVFEVDLVHDANARGHDLEGFEGLHGPLHERVALGVALELKLGVEVERVLAAVIVDLHGVVDHQVHRCERLDYLGVFAQAVGGAAHGGEVRKHRNAGQVLQHDTREHEGDFLGARGVGFPVGNLADIRFVDFFAVAIAQYRLEHDAHRNGQARDFDTEGFFQHRQ